MAAWTCADDQTGPPDCRHIPPLGSNTTITSINDAPATLTRAFFIFRIARTGGAATATFASWKAALVTEDGFHVIWVDCADAGHVKTRRVLAQLGQRMVMRWEGPFRSPGPASGGMRVHF